MGGRAKFIIDDVSGNVMENSFQVYAVNITRTNEYLKMFLHSTRDFFTNHRINKDPLLLFLELFEFFLSLHNE